MATHHHAFDATAIMKFSLEHQNPLVTGLISGSENGYPATHFSLLKVSDLSILLWSLKPSEEGIEEGLIARFWNMNEKKALRPYRYLFRLKVPGNPRILKPILKG